MEKIKATVNRITYHNDDSGYTVLRCEVDGLLEYNDYTVVCTMNSPCKGMVANFNGSWIKDPKYGTQFKAESFEEVLPTSPEGVENYLASGLIKGVGKATAHKIVEYFGKDTLDVLDNNPERLNEIPGIRKKKAQKIADSWKANEEIKKIMIFLQGCGITPNLAMKIYKQYGKDSIAKVKENPYALADDIWGVGFKIADSIAQKTGLSEKCPERIKAGVIYALKRLAEEGHVYEEFQSLVTKTCEPDILGFDTTDKILIEDNINALLRDGKLIKGLGESIYLPMYYHAEKETASKLLNMLSFKCKEQDVDINKIQKEVCKRTGCNIVYDDTQVMAIKTAVNSRITILTGGPGTGKTTVANGIIQAFLDMKLDIVCASPTGKAAKRLSESVSLEAKTIHRLLEFGRDGKFKKNEEDPIDGDVLILDECSMIDQLLMSSLLKAVPVNIRIVFIGDVDQLPSVGAGNVFKSMIDSHKIPTVRLNVIHRQGKTSLIIENAQRILAGGKLIVNQKDGDCFFKEANSDNIQDIIKTFVSNIELFKSDFNSNDIQILCPMKRNNGGTQALNVMMQETLNPSGKIIGGTKFRVGDRVIQMKNNYDKEVFNGDTGIITSYNEEDDEIIINFDGREVEYDKSDLNEIQHSWAITIHKSQGSEMPVVVIPLLMDSYIMLRRNLIYTGATRAKKLLVFIGEQRAVYTAIHNNNTQKRNTNLCELLKTN